MIFWEFLEMLVRVAKLKKAMKQLATWLDEGNSVDHQKIALTNAHTHLAEFTHDWSCTDQEFIAAAGKVIPGKI